MEKKGIFLTHRHISWMLSLFVVSLFFVFIAGYFLGKKKAVEKFYNKVDQESLSDHIYYSVCSMYEDDENVIKQESTEDRSSEENSSDLVNSSIGEGSVGARKMLDIQAKASKSSIAKIAKNTKKQPEKMDKMAGKNLEKFYAELIGFGTIRAANRFSDKLKKQGFSVALKKRRSKSARGKTIVWYQIITEKFDNKSDLIAFVDIIKDKEKLKGVRIVQC
ncbi:hypothetical protein ACFLYU_04880 [Candidatus Dependentiae bacterium]